MRIISTALAAAAVGAVAAGFTATVATAQGNDDDITSFGFTVTPKTVKPGGRVELTVTECDKEATAASAVFDKTTLGTGGGTQSAQVMVDLDAKPGASFDVTFTCGAESGTAPLTIAAAGGGKSETGSTSRPRQEQGKEATQSALPSQPGKEGAEPAEPGKEKEAVSQAEPAHPVKPAHPARGGLGGSQEDRTVMLSGGAGLTAAGAFGGALLLRRRDTPGRD
ncbi:hypothetical protein OG946_03060 [Streptomyces sp. NBC_01808]|uniref:hypothetical protein n=1 Tax=Streptomyces sp. NBC_01808 TaxID=2975947 RepID=UPI002DD96945|nr:hypothetical protein [Streptomyces sp. NBC_01808]WSA36445.1 hypothetical protein OG946_03060 [Streptomyces sp. NBC_01808]